MTTERRGGRVYHVQKSFASKTAAQHAMQQLRDYGLLALISEKTDRRGKKFYDLLVHYGKKRR